MIRNAYQGTEARKLVMIARIVLPAYQTFSDFSNKQISAKQLGQFGAGCQVAGLNDYALFARQVFISTKDKFDEHDIKFIRENLNQLIDEKETEAIIEKLSKEKVAQFSIRIESGDSK